MSTMAANDIVCLSIVLAAVLGIVGNMWLLGVQ